MDPRFGSAVAAFGLNAKAKLANPAARGEPEDQLRAPLEHLVVDLAECCGFPRNAITAVGESSLSEMKTRPDYAITVRKALVGFIEVKAPGKGADPRKFKDRHDKGQWEKLQSLPNLIYTDGNEFSLWRNGEIEGALVRLTGNIETAGASLGAPPSLQALLSARLDALPPAERRLVQDASVLGLRFTVEQRYAVEVVLPQWQTLLDQLSATPPRRATV